MSDREPTRRAAIDPKTQAVLARYRGYLRDDLARLLEDQGLEVSQDEPHLVSKVVAATRPLDRGCAASPAAQANSSSAMIDSMK